MAEDKNPEGVTPAVVADVDVVKDEGIVIPVEDMTADDALAVLVKAKPVRASRRVAVEVRVGDADDDVREIPATIRSLTGPEIKEIRKAAEKPLNREQRRKGEEAEVDDALYRRIIIANALTLGDKPGGPKLNDPKILAAHGVERGDQVVEKLILDGHQTILFAKIMETTGYSEDAVRDLGEG